MYYDLHIHSCLSPCSNDDMTPNNIANMACIKGLDVISVTDHNSLKQQRVMKKVCDAIGIKYIYGTELQTIEEVHVLAYFKRYEDVILMSSYVEQHRMKVENNKEFFGHQYLMNEKDEIIGEEDDLLLVSLDVSLEEIIDVIHFYHGRVVLAHVLDRSNSITNQLGFIPKGLNFDALEVKDSLQQARVLKMHPHLSKEDTIFLFNSDAHQLIDISEKEAYLTHRSQEMFWGCDYYDE